MSCFVGFFCKCRLKAYCLYLFYTFIFTDQDGAEPSTNSVAAMNLLRLSHFLDRADLHKMAVQLLASFSQRLSKIPVSAPYMAAAVNFLHSKTKQVSNLFSL